MNVAFVYDRVNKWGGAERVLLALHKIWPDAPLYSAVYSPEKAQWADVFEVHPSFLKNLPHEYLPWITPVAFETFNFDAYDVVISVTSAEAKNIITKPGTIHICYCLTPTRYLWSGKNIYEESGLLGIILRILSPMLKKWDLVAAARPDIYLAISETVKKRIKRFYHQDADVLYPPVDINMFKVKSEKLKAENYFLAVSRLVPYKRVDILVDAFNRLGYPLVIIGNGSSKEELESRAKKNIRFVGEVSEKELIGYYAKCKAYVFAGVEDFGIAAVEAQAAGKPVIAYREGGMEEIVIPGVTGELFETQSAHSLMGVLESFDDRLYDSALCKKNAERFSEVNFCKNMKETVERLYNTLI